MLEQIILIIFFVLVFIYFGIAIIILKNNRKKKKQRIEFDKALIKYMKLDIELTNKLYKRRKKMEFKIGDKVRILEDVYGRTFHGRTFKVLTKGKIAIVKETIFDFNLLIVKEIENPFNDKHWSIIVENVELVKEKDDLEKDDLFDTIIKMLTENISKQQFLHKMLEHFDIEKEDNSKKESKVNKEALDFLEKRLSYIKNKIDISDRSREMQLIFDLYLSINTITNVLKSLINTEEKNK